MFDPIPVTQDNTFCNSEVLFSNQAVASITNFTQPITCSSSFWRYPESYFLNSCLDNITVMSLHILHCSICERHCINFSTLCWLYLQDSCNKEFQLLFEQS